MVWPRLGGKNVEILCRIDDELPARIKGDPHRIKQVLVNLMGNAIKFTDEGEIELSLAVEQREGEHLLIHACVRDTGIGIAPGKLEDIFNLFEQADGTTTRKYGGTGLGLAICRQIARLMRGEVWAESSPDKGSTFHFTLLLRRSADREVRRIMPGSLAGKRALIADDNRANLDILMHALQLARMEVIGCLSGEEALNVLQGACGRFDICIFDIKMPTLDGYELARRIRDIYGDGLPMLAFSSSVQRGSARECLKAGFNGYLPKPINRIKLFKMIERLLGVAVDGKLLEQGPQAMIITQHSMREDAKLSVSILLAEDNIVNQKLAATLLIKAGYKVTVASNGRQAVERFTEDPCKYDIVFMDVQMPELNGIEATRELRRLGFDRVPIIALTAQAMKGDREKCLAAGMSDYLAKPIKREAVFEMLRRWVFDRSSEHLLPCDRN
jgi:CheY-like chemotaxis protein